MSHTINGTAAQIKEMLEYYDGYLIKGENAHTIARAKLENVSVTFYTTNTILFQGKSEDGEYNIWAKKFNLPIESEVESNYASYQTASAIGCDEVGTGDYFGPVVVCSCFVRADQIEQLKHLGVKDSKLLMDDVIIDLALKLKNIVQYSILVLPPERFNALHKPEENNLNFIKACLHNNAILSLKNKLQNTKPDVILIDEFTPVEKYAKTNLNITKRDTILRLYSHGEVVDPKLKSTYKPKPVTPKPVAPAQASEKKENFTQMSIFDDDNSGEKK